MTKNQNLDDHYKILEISENATDTEIKAAYRRLMFIHHPDKNPNDRDEAHSATVKINLAYEILSNEKIRRQYDTVRRYERSSRNGAEDTTQYHEYAEARAKYQESEFEARERLRRWVYENLGTRPTKKHRCYTPQGNGTKLDTLITKIDRRLRNKVWEYRIRNDVTPISENRMKYRIRIVCDPSKCEFREAHPEWVENYFYGLFKTGTSEDVEYNNQLAYTWLGDILEETTYSYEIDVFFGVVGSWHAPWRCYVNLTVVLVISGFDVFLQSSVPILTKFGKENKLEVAKIFNHLTDKVGTSIVDLWYNKTLRNYVARKSENILRSQMGMRKLKEE